MADITTTYYLNTSKSSDSRLYGYFSSGTDKKFAAGNSDDNRGSQLAWESYTDRYKTSYFKPNRYSTSGVSMDATNSTHYPIGGSLTVKRASMGAYTKERTLFYGYSTANSYTVGTAHAGTVAQYNGVTINPTGSPGPTTTFWVGSDFCEQIINGRFITIGCAIKPTSSSYPESMSNYIGIYLEDATDVILEIDWNTRNTAPYWGNGQTLNVSADPAPNNGYVAAGTTFTVSWNAANDTQNNINNYRYGISTNDGASYTYAWTGSASSRSFTYQNSTQGAIISFLVQARDSNGLSSPWIFSSDFTVNYAPSAPTNLQFSNDNGSTYNPLAANSVLKVTGANTLLSFSEASHGGGFAPGYSAIKYKQIGSVTGADVGASPIGLANLADYAGSDMSVGVAATDGWALASTSTYNCRVGLVLSGGAISLMKSSGGAQTDTTIDQLTNISCARTYIDTVDSMVNETTTLQYQIDGGAWTNLLSTIRLNTSNTFTGVFKEILTNNPSFLQANHTVNFRVNYTINHLSLTSNTLTTNYKKPTFVQYLSEADGSTTFKYAIGKTDIPITYISVGAYYNFTRGSTYDDNIGYIQCQCSIDNGLTWANHGSLITINGGVNSSNTVTILFASLPGFTKGKRLLVRLHIYMSLDGITYTLSNVTSQWNNASALTIVEFNALPTVTLSRVLGERLSLITNTSETNQVILPFGILNNSDEPIDFIIGIKIHTAPEVFCYKNNTTKAWFSLDGLEDEERILKINAGATEGVGGIWALTTLQIDSLLPVLSLSSSVPDNTKDIVVTIKAYVQEGLSGGRSETININNTNQTVTSQNYLINTLCQPKFRIGTLTLTRL